MPLLRALGGATLFAQTLCGDQFGLALPTELPAAGLDLVALLAAQHPDSEDLAPGEFRLIASDVETVVSPLCGAAALKMQTGEITAELMVVFLDPDELAERKAAEERRAAEERKTGRLGRRHGGLAALPAERKAAGESKAAKKSGRSKRRRIDRRHIVESSDEE